MAEVNAKVMEMIEAEIKKNPKVSNKELFEKATALDKSVGKLSARQFNARYPLQVKRAMKPKKPRAQRPARGRKARTVQGAAATDGKGRDRIRNVLLELARDVANAQDRGGLIDVVVGIDRYVDRVVKAAS
jgi:hypothetical protein